MTDREKVIKELSWLIYNFPFQKNPKDEADRMCNAINMYCNDALAILKEQEPRVLTLEEVRSGSVEVAWIEDKNRRIFGSDIIPGLWFRFSNVGEDEAVDIHIRDGFVGARLEVYGKMWRAWTSRPSPEQMRGTPWEVSDETV